jgi:hypothetical protein
MKWVGYISHTRDIRNPYKTVCGNLKDRDHGTCGLSWEDNMRTDIRMWTRIISLRTGISGVFF